MMNLLYLLLTLLLMVPVYSQTGQKSLSDSLDIVKTKDGYVLGKKSDFEREMLKVSSKLEDQGYDVDTKNIVDCLVTKIESVDKVTYFKDEAIPYMTEECFCSNTKINKSNLGKTVLKGLSTLKGTGFDIDTNNFVECFATKYDSLKSCFLFKDTIRYITEACIFSSIKINKRDFGKTMLKGLSALKGTGLEIDTNNCIECILTKFKSSDNVALFKNDPNNLVKACLSSSMKINKSEFLKLLLKKLRDSSNIGIDIDTNNCIECLTTRLESLDKDVFLFKKDTVSYIVQSCVFSNMKINQSSIRKIVSEGLSNLEGSGFDIDTIKYVECFTNKYESLDKVTLITRDTFNYIAKVCLYSSMKVNKSDILKVVLKEFSNSKNPGYDIDTTNCIECLTTKLESLDKDVFIFKKDTVSYIVKACISRSLIIKDSMAIKIALIEFCKDSLTRNRDYMKKLSIAGKKSIQRYCDCFATNLLKIEESKRQEIINEYKLLSGEYNNNVVFPCIQIAQGKRRQKNDMYNPNDIVGSVVSSTVELLRIGESKMVPITIGDITKYYVLDTGSDLLLIDDKSEQELINSKKLLPSMFIGEKQLSLADNRQVNAKIYKINKVKIGDYIVRNVEIGVIENGFLLCGMSLLKKFKDWKIESELNVLKLFK